MQYEEILKLVKGVSEAGLTNFEYTEGNIRIVMSCPENKQAPAAAPVVSVQEGGQQVEIPAPAPAPAAPAPAAAPAAPASDDQSGNIVKCPLVGTFYVAPSEDAPAP